LVKTLHPIDTISSRISQADDRVVRLARVVETERHGRQSSLLDPALATARALAEPLGFPPLAAAVVPGDHVAIVVDTAVPCAAAVVRGVVDELHRSGINDDAISIVTTYAEFGQRCRDELENAAGSAIHSVTHDPHDETNLCFLGLPKKREPLLVNRTIYDADIVLPIGCARLDNRGAYDVLFPSFAGAEAVDRYRTPARHDSDAAHADMLRETNEAGWLIGAPLVIQVVPGAGETVASVVAGDPQAVAKRSAELCREQWSLASPQRASLVVAILGGPAAAQTWENVGRALAAAERLVAEEGAIAICSNLDEPPGESLGRLIGSSDLYAAERRISHDHAADSWPAWRLARALQRGSV
jgi:nickel-dependent lactate racemase